MDGFMRFLRLTFGSLFDLVDHYFNHVLKDNMRARGLDEFKFGYFLRSSLDFILKPSQSAIIQPFERDFIPPNGWSKDPEEIFPQETYQDPESEGYVLLKSLGLRTVTPVMAHSRRNGGALHIFESGGNFYLWNIIEGTVRRFQDKDFDKILQSMTENDGGTKKLQFEKRLIA